MRLGYEDCIQHVRMTLADICVQPTLSDVSPWRFLNRASLLFQVPLCFAVFRLCTTGYILDHIDRNTMRDPLYHRDFAKALAGIGVAYEAGASAPKERLDNYAISLFDTDFSVVAFRVRGGHHEPCCIQEISFVPIPREHPIGATLSAVFAPFGPVLQEMGIQDHLKHQFPGSTYINAPYDNPLEFRMDQNGLNGLKIVQQYYQDLTREVVDDEIGRILESPALHQSEISRFLLCIKVFDRHDIRFGHYFYDIKICIPDDQKKQIKDKLSGSTMSTLHRLRPFCNADAAAWVWDRVQSGEHEAIFALLETPLSRSSRLFCEYTLLSGAAILNVDPFSRGDIGWYHEEDGRDKQTVDYNHEMRRFASLHYILLSMADDLSRPALLTLPIRVDGATWMSVTTVVRTDEHPDYSGIVDANEFERRFSFYHSLMRDFETRIRRKSKQRYLWAVAKILSDKINEVLRVSKQLDNMDANCKVEVVLLAEHFAALTNDLLNLCRLYPYKPVLFGPFGAADRYGWNEVRLTPGYDVGCGIAGENPCFDRMQLREFLSSKEVSMHVRQVMNSEIGLEVIRKRKFRVVTG